MSNGWVDINSYNGPPQAYQNEQSFAWHPGPAAAPINPKTGLPFPPLPGVPGHYITGDYEATLRNQGFTPAQAAVLSALNTWRWKQLGAQQAGQPVSAPTSAPSLAPSGAPAASLASLPTDPRQNAAIIGGNGTGNPAPSGFSYQAPAAFHPPVLQTPPINPRRHLLNILG